MFEGFLHPALLWGTALAAVPLIIHILNRRRHRPLVWGAMRFVLAAHKRTRRRVQLEKKILAGEAERGRLEPPLKGQDQ